MTELSLECGPGVHLPGPSSFELARLVSRRARGSVLDLGCGTGLCAITAARNGAREVWATDIDPGAVACARRNASRSGVHIHVAQGDLFEPALGRRFDVIVTNPPQTPGPQEACGPKFAGPDGLCYFERILRDAPRFLTGLGGLITMLVSLADTRRFESLLRKSFGSFAILGEQQRSFTREEYDAYHPGLFDYHASRRRRGLAHFEEDRGRFSFLIRFYEAPAR